MKFQRDVFIDVIYNEALVNKNIIFVSADFGAPSLDKFRENLPNQFIHSGISEQHMIDMAGGLALSGKKVYVYAMAPFITLRCIEQIKCSLAMMNLDVTILAVGVGLGYADAGPTHYSNEDIGCMKSIAGLDILSASDEFTTKLIAKKTLDEPKLRVIRLERHALPAIYNEEILQNKKGYEILNSSNKICVLTYGHLLHRANDAVKKLNKENVKIGLIDIFAIKPISKTIIEELKKYKTLITFEEQCLSGGFGSSVLEYISDNDQLIKVKRLGLPEKYIFDNGGRDYLLDLYGLSTNELIKEIKIELDKLN